MYFISPELEQNYDEFQGIWEKLRRSEKASDST
jgi:hypothetical protein